MASEVYFAIDYCNDHYDDHFYNHNYEHNYNNCNVHHNDYDGYMDGYSSDEARDGQRDLKPFYERYAMCGSCFSTIEPVAWVGTLFYEPVAVCSQGEKLWLSVSIPELCRLRSVIGAPARPSEQ